MRSSSSRDGYGTIPSSCCGPALYDLPYSFGQFEFQQSGLKFDRGSVRNNFCWKVDYPQNLARKPIDVLDLSTLSLVNDNLFFPENDDPRGFNARGELVCFETKNVAAKTQPVS